MKAKERQRESGGAVPVKSPKPPIDTRKEVSVIAEVSDNTIARVEKKGIWLDENYPRGGDKPSIKDKNFEGTNNEPSKMPVDKKESANSRKISRTEPDQSVSIFYLLSLKKKNFKHLLDTL